MGNLTNPNHRHARLDTLLVAQISLRLFKQGLEVRMNSKSQIWCVLTDSHFLIPLAVFVIGLAMLIAVH